MKRISNIFLWAFIIISLLPLFEYTLFQWRNDNRISITGTSRVQAVNLTENYVTFVLPSEINSFSDYIIYENHYGNVNAGVCIQQGLPKIIFLTTIRVIRVFSNDINQFDGNFQIQILTISFLLSRTVFVGVALLLTYITVLPVLLVHDLLQRRLLK